jgi:hypothetical protein
MIRSDNWRSLRASFESLDTSRDSTLAGIHFTEAGWLTEGSFASSGSFQTRFRAFATQGGAMAKPGTVGVHAFHAWLDLLRERVPHYFFEMSGSTDRSAEVPLSKIRVPEADVLSQLPDAQDGSLIVEESGEGFVVIENPSQYLTFETPRDATIPCIIHRETHDGVQQYLRQASMELCELFEAEATVRECAEASPPSRQPETSCGSTGAAIDHYRRQCEWSVETLAAKVNLDEKSIDNHIHDRVTVRHDNLAKYARVFSAHLRRKINPADLRAGTITHL